MGNTFLTPIFMTSVSPLYLSALSLLNLQISINFLFMVRFRYFSIVIYLTPLTLLGPCFSRKK